MRRETDLHHAGWLTLSDHIIQAQRSKIEKIEAVKVASARLVTDRIFSDRPIGEAAEPQPRALEGFLRKGLPLVEAVSHRMIVAKECCGPDGTGARLPFRWPEGETEKILLFTAAIKPG